MSNLDKQVLVLNRSWQPINVVLADKRINNIRSNRTLEEAGLSLKIKPHQPAAKPFHETVRSNLKFPEWEFFVKKK